MLALIFLTAPRQQLGVSSMRYLNKSKVFGIFAMTLCVVRLRIIQMKTIFG